MRTFVLCLAILLCGAAPAAAAEITLKIGPSSGVVVGDSHEVSGVLTDDDGDRAHLLALPPEQRAILLEVLPAEA